MVMKFSKCLQVRSLCGIAVWLCIIRWILKWLKMHAGGRAESRCGNGGYVGIKVGDIVSKNGQDHVSLRQKSGCEFTFGNKGKGRTDDLTSFLRDRQSRVQSQQKGSGMKSIGKNGKRPIDDHKSELWTAVEMGDLAYVQALLDNGASVNETHRSWTPLMKACEEGHVEITQMLLDRRSNMEAFNKKGRTALSFAAAPSMDRQPNLAVLQLVLEAGADIDHSDARGETAKDRAIRDGFYASASAIDAFCVRLGNRALVADSEVVASGSLV